MDGHADAESLHRAGNYPRMKATTIKLSICPCGFPTLNDDVPIDTEYELDLASVSPCEYVCGGCGKRQHIMAVMADRRKHSAGGFLPLDLFDPNPTSAAFSA